jgi:hypothetical protein
MGRREAMTPPEEHRVKSFRNVRKKRGAWTFGRVAGFKAFRWRKTWEVE